VLQICGIAGIESFLLTAQLRWTVRVVHEWRQTIQD